MILNNPASGFISEIDVVLCLPIPGSFGSTAPDS